MNVQNFSSRKLCNIRILVWNLINEKEYDFSKDERGKFYNEEVVFNTPNSYEKDVRQNGCG